MIHKISDEKGVSFNTILQIYFFEGFLDRLMHSKFKDDFVLKGGLLLSMIVGIHQRATLDIDFNVLKIRFKSDHLKQAVMKIIRIIRPDGITYSLIKFSDIMLGQTNTGYQIALVGTFENIRVPFTIDIAYGDPITPSKINYQYYSLVTKKKIDIHTYNLETVLAEKIQTIFDKQLDNSRMKDFYDIYIVSKLKTTSIDFHTLKSAILNTFKFRNTPYDIEALKNSLKLFSYDEAFNHRWKNFVNKNPYAEVLEFEEIVIEIEKILDALD